MIAPVNGTEVTQTSLGYLEDKEDSNKTKKTVERPRRTNPTSKSVMNQRKQLRSDGTRLHQHPKQLTGKQCQAPKQNEMNKERRIWPPGHNSGTTRKQTNIRVMAITNPWHQKRPRRKITPLSHLTTRARQKTQTVSGQIDAHSGFKSAHIPCAKARQPVCSVWCTSRAH